MKVNAAEELDYSCIRRRIAALFLDYLSWYIIYFLMILAFYINRFGMPDASNDLIYYKNSFDSIIKTPLFSITYLSIIVLMEIIIPLITNGQSISKKVLKIKVVSLNNCRINLLLRSVLKIIILNPYGVIAYISGAMISERCVDIISNILSVLFIISIFMVFKYKVWLHDKISKTSVKSA